MEKATRYLCALILISCYLDFSWVDLAVYYYGCLLDLGVSVAFLVKYKLFFATKTGKQYPGIPSL